MGILVAIGVPLALLVIAELGRTLVARVFGFQADRYPFKLMKLPGTRGSTGFRLALILAGPIAAYLAISALAFGYYGCYGFTAQTNRVESTAPEHDSAGKLAADDVIVEVDGAPFAGGTYELSKRVNAKRGAPITLAIERDGTRKPVTIQPNQLGENRWVIGVRLQTRVKDIGRAFREAIAYPVAQTATVLRSIVDIVSGKEEADVGGPVRIVDEFKDAFVAGAQQMLGLAMVFAVYALLALALFDLVRALLLILFRS